VPSDKPKEVTVRLKRMTDFNARDWYSGSTHVHMYLFTSQRDL
jgi:hypothetical protein